MPYDVASIGPGDIILVAGTRQGESFGARLLDSLISWATVNPFHHVAIVGFGRMIEALWHVECSPLDKYANTGWAYRVSATGYAQHLAASWAEKRVGEPYGLAELLADGARDILHIPVGARWHPRRYTCSGLVAMAYQQAGVTLTHAPLPTPADLSYSPLLIGRRPWE